MPVDPDFGLTVADYAQHRADYPGELFERLAALGFGHAGQRLLDLGTGTGALARVFAQADCQVTGLDPSAQMLQGARQLSGTAGQHISWLQGRAEQTGLRSQSFDLVSAGQSWHWFDADRAAREVARVLKPDGRLLIAQFDWLPIAGNLVAAVEKLILRYSPNWHLGGGTGLYPERFVQLGEAGFVDIESFSFDVQVPYRHEAWRGRIRASAGVGGSLPAAEVARFDADHQELLRRDFPQDPLAVPHRVFAILARPPRAALLGSPAA
jgi:SAM-dependent methyltransferase